MLSTGFSAIVVARDDNRVVAETTLVDDYVNKTLGHCSFNKTQITLSYDDMGFLGFVFTRGDHNGGVMLHLKADFQPAALFSEQISVEKGHTCFQHAPIYVGSDIQSYKCQTDMKYIYHRSACEDGEISASTPYNFHLEVYVRHIQSQGFNVDQPFFGHVFYCKDDKLSKILLIVVSFTASVVTVVIVCGVVSILRSKYSCPSESNTNGTEGKDERVPLTP